MSTAKLQQRASTIRTRIIVASAAFLIAGTALLVSSCSDDATEPTHTTGQIEPLTGFGETVSEPIAVSPPASSGRAPALEAAFDFDPSLSGAASDSVSYVSLRPGSLPEADSVRIVNVASGIEVSAITVDGGIDPIAIPAAVGDTLEIVPFEGDEPQPALRVLVPPRMPPVVVRTDPPHRKTKVPLNTSLLVVFSEPMDGGTITLGNIQLLREGQVVPADVTLDSKGLRAEIRPESPLEPGFEYTLSIGTGVTDRSGDPLEQTTAVTFSTISGSTMVQLTAGLSHTCGLTADGQAYCWGSNEYGQLGDGAGGAGIRQLLPVRVAGGHAFAMLAAGTNHACGLTVTGVVLCWGRNDQGQLGDGSQADHDSPARIAGSEVYVAVTAGLNHTCARSATDTYCWGQNVGTVLGDFTVSPDPSRARTTGGLTWSRIDYVARDTIDRNWGPLIWVNGDDITVYTWGQPPEGRAALDLATLSIPQDGGVFPRELEIVMDAQDKCTVTVGGGAWCTRTGELVWWDFDQYDYGVGVEVCVGNTRCSVPGFDVSYWQRPETSLHFSSGVVSGQLHSCALTPAGAAYCWGAADRGQLGRPATDLVPRPPRESVGHPGPVMGNLSFTILAAGEYHTCGVTRSGETYCWGANGFGQLGDGTQVDRYAPVRVNLQP